MKLETCARSIDDANISENYEIPYFRIIKIHSSIPLIRGRLCLTVICFTNTERPKLVTGLEGSGRVSKATGRGAPDGGEKTPPVG